MKIGDRVYVHGHVDEIRKDCVIIRNEGGYFGTVKSEIVEAQKTEDIVSVIRCKDCRYLGGRMESGYYSCGNKRGCVETVPEGFCGWAIPEMDKVEHETD